jgi:hypothetical protein
VDSEEGTGSAFSLAFPAARGGIAAPYRVRGGVKLKSAGDDVTLRDS